jgi:hypothetical protein
MGERSGEVFCKQGGGLSEYRRRMGRVLYKLRWGAVLNGWKMK